MWTVLKHCGAVLAGLVVGVVVVAGVEGVSSVMYPPPEGLDFNDREAMGAYVKQMPLGAFLFVLAAWAAGSLAGTSVATLLAPKRSFVPGLVVTVFLFAASVMNLVMVPGHPVWFWIAGLAMSPLSGGIALRLFARWQRPS